MSEFSSVLELAREVASQANRIKSGRNAELNAERVLYRVSDTKRELQTLEQAVAAARRLEEVSGVKASDLTGLDDGRTNLERLAQQWSYLPSDSAFNAAKKKIGDAAKRVTRDFKGAWDEWVRQEVDRVPSIKISQLDLADQAEARARWIALVKVSKVPSPKTGDINLFKSDRDYLHEVLGDLPDLPGPVRELYDRLGQRPSPTLADITDEQIAELRKANVDAQIEVRRRGV